MRCFRFVSRGATATVSVLFALSCLVSTASAAGTAAGSAPPAAAVAAEARSLLPWMSERFEHLHRIPERLFDLPKTSAYVRAQLDELGIAYKYPYAESGLIATLGEGKPVFLLRADMDALPVTERTNLSYASETSGMMHACGHDAHMTMLLGAAKMLKARSDAGTLPAGTIKLLFQPAEEGGGGAGRVVAEGGLDGVDAAFGIHQSPLHAVGKVAYRAGPMLAGSAAFQVTFKGRGGHAGMPQLAIDSVLAAAQFVTAAQSLVARETDPFDAAVVSITRIETLGGASDVVNIIPAATVVSGSLRGMKRPTLEHIRDRIDEVARGIGAALRCRVECNHFEKEHPLYPPLVTDAAMTQQLGDAVHALFGEEGVSNAISQAMGSEDFAFIAEKVPSAFAAVGTYSEAVVGHPRRLHAPDMIIDEKALAVGAALHTQMALAYLETHPAKPEIKDEL